MSECFDDKVAAIALFCEDVRNEATGTFSVVGLIPAPIGLAKFPTTVPKLGIVLVVKSPAKLQLTNYVIRLDATWLDVPLMEMNVQNSNLGPPPVEEDGIVFSDAMHESVLHMVTHLLEVPKPGKLIVRLKSGDKTYRAGVLRFVSQPKPAPESTAAEKS